MEEDKKDIEQYVAYTLMGRPYGFSVGDRHFALHPVTLGKMYLLQPCIDSLGIDPQNVQRNLPMEALRLAGEKKDACLTIICYHTCKTKDEVEDTAMLAERKALFERELSEEDIAALMIILLSSDRTAVIMKHFGIDKEQDRLAEVLRIKARDDKNNLTFGGKSVFGSLIDTACERYGWTKDYVVWGIDYTSLRLMLADKVNSIYCTDEEMKRIPARFRYNSDAILNADGRQAMELIRQMSWR